MASMVNQLKKIGAIRTYNKGEYAFSAGDIFSGLYYVVSGEFVVLSLGRKGQQFELIRAMPGEIMGLPLLFSQFEKYTIFGLALKNSKCIFIKKEKFLHTLKINKQLCGFLMKMMARHILMLTRRMVIIRLKNPEQRVAQYILGLRSTCQSNDVLLDKKKLDIASHLDMTPETLSRVLKRMQEDQTIEVSGKKVNIKNVLGLHNRVME